MSLHVARSFGELMAEAREAEENKDWEKAAGLYERASKARPHEEQPYNRLMIIYRKLKRYEDELKIIRKAIAAFEELYQAKSGKLLGHNQVATRLSGALARSLGQKGKKTELLYYPEPLPKWIKREKVVEKKTGQS